MVEGGGSKIFRQAKTWLYRYPDESKKLLQIIAELCVEYLARQVVAGAQLVMVFDSWAGELSPSSFSDFALPYLDIFPGGCRSGSRSCKSTSCP